MANERSTNGRGQGDADLLPQLQAERDSLDPSFMHSSKLLDREIERVKSGRPATEDKKYLEVHTMNPTKVAIKVLLPVKDHPKFNFVGKLLGPGGTTMKKLQQDTHCRMAIMGKGSMKDKRKEEEFRKDGDPKHAHLNDPLHLNIEALAPAAEAYARLASALKEIQPYLNPDREDVPGGHHPADMGMNPYENGGRIDSRGPPPPRGNAPPLHDDRGGYRDDPYYDAPPPAAAPPRGYDDYRAPPPRDAYDRAPPRDYERGPPPSDMRGAPPPRGPPPREGFYDYGHSSSSAPAPARDRYDEYDSRGGWGGQSSSAAPYKSGPPPYKGGSGGATRGRAPPERQHPYGGSGRGAPRY